MASAVVSASPVKAECNIGRLLRYNLKLFSLFFSTLGGYSFRQTVSVICFKMAFQVACSVLSKQRIADKTQEAASFNSECNIFLPLWHNSLGPVYLKDCLLDRFDLWSLHFYKCHVMFVPHLLEVNLSVCQHLCVRTPFLLTLRQASLLYHCRHLLNMPIHIDRLI